MTSDHQEFEQDRPGLISRLCCMQSSPETDPRLFSTGKKTVIMSLVIMCASTGGLYATVCFPGYPAMTDEFNVPSVVTTMVGALYILFGGLALVVWAAISERFCVRRPLLLCGALIVTGSSVGLALMTNMAGIVTLRCIQATGTSAYLVLCSGIVADCYPVEKRGTAMSLLFFGFFFGPLFGPIIGGALVATPLSWRATFWFCSAYGLATFILLLFLFPETFRNDIVLDGPPRVDSGIDRLINNNAEEQHIDPPKKSSSSMLAPLLLLQYPHVLLASLVGCIAFSCLFVVETILPELLASRYGFSSWQIGLSYIGSGCGNMLGTLVNGILSDRLLLRARRQREGQLPKVEDRLAMHIWPAGFIIMPVGLLMIGWSLQLHKSFWIAIVGFGVQTFGSQQVSSSISAYLLDSVPGQGASVTAASSLITMTMACILSIAANPLVHIIDSGFTLLIFAGLVQVAMSITLCLKLFGQRMRRKSGFEQPDEVQSR